MQRSAKTCSLVLLSFCSLFIITYYWSASMRMIPLFMDILPETILIYPSIAGNKSYDRALTDQWENNWLVTFSTSKIKLASFQYHHSDSVISQIMMKDCTLKEASCYEHVFDLRFNSDVKWNS